MRLARTAALAAALVSPLLMVPAAAPAYADNGADQFGDHTPVMVVIDTSGSMDEVVSSSGRRIDAARSAMLDLVTALPSGQPYGLVSYPGGAQDDSGCTTGKLQTRLGPLDRVAASAAIRRLRPDGDTPTGPAMRHARDVIEEAGYVHGTIVLVSDGEANCGPPPCEVAEQIIRSGYDVVINTVGFEVDGEAEEELTCVADATGGEYTPVDDADDLSDAIGASAGAHLELSIDAPATADVATGSDPGEQASFVIAVTSDGRFPAHDVRVSLTVGTPDSPGGVLVPRPVRFLGNLAPGDIRIVSIGARPDEVLSNVTWTVTATAENAAPVRRTGELDIDERVDKDDLGPVLSDAERVIVLGDSYSSGEGIGVYTDTNDDRCHRADDTYAGVIWGEDAQVVACSGAVTADFFHRQVSHGGVKQTPQLLKLRAEAVSAEPPDAVLLSIGGNDAGFTHFATLCIFRPKCQYLTTDQDGNLVTSLTDMLQRAGAIQGDVYRVLRAVDAAVNDKTALERRGGEIAPVVILPYPRIMPRAEVGVGGCLVWLSTSELDDLNQYLDALNTAVSLAAYRLHAKGRPVYVVEDVVESFQPDHTICEGAKSYAVTDRWRDLLDAELNALFDKNELLHPNRDGHRAMARALVEWSSSRAATPVAVEGTPTYAQNVQDVADPTWLDNAALAVLDFVTGPVDEVSAPEAVDADGFAAGTEVSIYIDSATTILGTAAVDDDGRVSTNLRIPPWVEPGEHHIRVVGPNPDGDMVTQRFALTLHNRWTRAWLVLGGLGVLLTAAAVIALRRRRPQAAFVRGIGAQLSDPSSSATEPRGGVE